MEILLSGLQAPSAKHELGGPKFGSLGPVMARWEADTAEPSSETQETGSLPYAV